VREEPCDYRCAHLKHLPEVEIAVDALFSLIADFCKRICCGLGLCQSFGHLSSMAFIPASFLSYVDIILTGQ
jgi:hypothetical protein